MGTIGKKSAAILLALTACGGGGGGGTDSAFYAGIWRGNLVSRVNTCEAASPNHESTLTINQDGDKLVVESQSGRTYEGFVSPDGSFTASREEQIGCSDDNGNSNGSFSILVRTFSFTNLQGDQATGTFTDEFGNCTKNGLHDSSCRIEEAALYQRDPR